MKGLLLFSQLNDVLFMSLDDDTSTFINEQARRVSLIGVSLACDLSLHTCLTLTQIVTYWNSNTNTHLSLLFMKKNLL